MHNVEKQIERQSRDALIRELQAAGASIRGNAIRCPWHDDRHASGSIWQDAQGAWRFKCHVCDTGGDIYDIRSLVSGRDVTETLTPAQHQVSVPEREFMTLGDMRLAVSRSGQIEAEYIYENPVTRETELLVFRLQTKNGKTFKQCHPVTGGWVMRAPKKPWPLYNRVGIEQAEIVIATEGEKCANSLIALGFCGTTSPGGAGKAAHTDWGGLLILQGRLKEAEKILRQGLKLFKDDADLHYNLSIALNKQGRKL